MPKPQIDLKQRRNLGDLITVFFDFFKENLLPFSNIFLRYNGLFIIAFLGVSYLLITGFFGIIRSTASYPYDTVATESGQLYVGMGIFGFFVLFIITAVMNYSLAASYMLAYDEDASEFPNNSRVWKRIRDHLGKIILFVLLLFLLYIPIVVIGFYISYIPLLGTILQYFIGVIYTTWMGISFMILLKEDFDIGSALSEGWRLFSHGFWKAILVNFSISFLLMLLMFVVLLIPGFFMGIYIYHSTENSIDIFESSFYSIIWTLVLCLFLVLYTFFQSLSQFINSLLYFSLHEEVYNEAAQKRIEKIGSGE